MQVGQRFFVDLQDVTCGQEGSKTEKNQYVLFVIQILLVVMVKAVENTRQQMSWLIKYWTTGQNERTQ